MKNRSVGIKYRLKGLYWFIRSFRSSWKNIRKWKM